MTPDLARTSPRPAAADPAPGAAPSPERPMIDAALGEVDDDILVEEVDGRLLEVLSDGRRVPLDD